MKFNRAVSIPFAAASTALLSNCANFYEIPADYSGPTATLKDSAVKVGATKAGLFCIEDIDGKTTRNSPISTPYGGGMIVYLHDSTHQVPAKPLTITLAAYDGYAADGAALVDQMAGSKRETAEGELSFTPKAGKTYVAKGRLGTESSSVWLEEESTGRVVGRKFSSTDE